MYVRRMVGPERDRVTIEPNWETIASAILRLDNRDFYYIALDTGKQEPNMTIGGGKSVWCPPGYWASRYLVICTDAEGSWYMLSDPRIPVHYPHEAEATLCLGGQTSSFDADTCVYRETVLQAAETFSVRGKRDTQLRWIKNP